MSLTLHWSPHPPVVSGRYLYRQVGIPEVEHVCEVRIYADRSRKIVDDEDDTVDRVSQYEFKGPLPTGQF